MYYQSLIFKVASWMSATLLKENSDTHVLKNSNFIGSLPETDFDHSRIAYW